MGLNYNVPRWKPVSGTCVSHLWNDGHVISALDIHFEKKNNQKEKVTSNTNINEFA